MTYQMQPAIYSDSTATKWFHAAWIKELFENHPEVLEVAAFGYDYVITVQLQVDQVIHRYVQLYAFNISVLSTFLLALLEGDIGTAWLEGPPTNELIDVVTRSSLGFMCSKPVDELRRKYILQEHGEMMLEVMQRFPNITHAGKRANVLVSPNTWMFVRKNTEAVSGCTWMADPTVDRMVYRVKSPSQRARWARYDGPESEDALLCSHIYTREEVFAFAGVEDDMLKKQEAVKAEIAAEQKANDETAKKVSEAMRADDIVINPPNPICSKCGCSLSTNMAFGRGLEAMVCGECELVAEAEHGTERMVQDSLVFTCRKVYLPPAVQPTRFDPRPGIDDVGLGFYSPTWED